MPVQQQHCRSGTGMTYEQSQAVGLHHVLSEVVKHSASLPEHALTYHKPSPVRVVPGVRVGDRVEGC